MIATAFNAVRSLFEGENSGFVSARKPIQRSESLPVHFSFDDIQALYQRQAYRRKLKQLSNSRDIAINLLKATASDDDVIKVLSRT